MGDDCGDAHCKLERRAMGLIVVFDCKVTEDSEEAVDEVEDATEDRGVKASKRDRL